ncbi:MAG TPA: hypothetical protein VF995_10550 [Actinomycetota bacterium]
MNAEATVLRERTRTRTRLGGASARTATLPGAPSGGVAFATQVMAVPLRAVARPAGRRLSVAAALSLVLVALVSGLYDHADGGAGTTPTAARLPAPSAALAARPASALASTLGGSGASASASRPAAPARAPATASGASSADAAAVAWYAAQRHVPVSRVQALQHRQVNATAVEVMVTADTGPTGIYSDMVTVQRVGSTWKVP